jgi:hypothetical protein
VHVGRPGRAGACAAGEADPHCEDVEQGAVCGGVLATTIVRFGEQPDPLERCIGPSGRPASATSCSV